jgi:multiple sugar transport system substrate-binding protein
MASLARRVWLVLGAGCTLLLLCVTGVQAMDWQLHKGTAIRALFSKGALGSSIESFLPDFEKQTGIKVQFESFPEDQFRQKVLLELGAGTGSLDVFWTFAANEGLKFWRAGWYEPLDAYLKDPRLTDPAYDLADFSKKAMEGNLYDGRLIALPLHQNTSMLYYRKDLFEKHKLKVPQTLQELEETAKKLHNTDEGGQKLVGIVLRGKGAAATSQWAPFFLSLGGSWLDKSGRPAVNSPEAVQALDLYGRLLRSAGPPGAVNYHWYETVSLFAQGKAAMFIEANIRMPILEDATKSQVAGKVGYAMFPGGPAGRKPTMEVGSVAISSKSKKKEAAYLFAQWVTAKEAALRLQMKGIPVPRASAWKDTRFLAEMKNHPDWIEASQRSLDIADTNYNPPVVAVSEVRDRVGAAIVSSILGENVKAAADKAAAEMADIMEKTEKK